MSATLNMSEIPCPYATSKKLHKAFECALCKFVTSNANAFIYHIGDKHPSNYLPCITCGKLYSTGQSLIRHIEDDHDLLLYTCGKAGCCFQSTVQKNFLFHIVQCAPHYFPCSGCKKSFYSPENLIAHIEIGKKISETEAKEKSTKLLYDRFSFLKKRSPSPELIGWPRIASATASQPCTVTSSVQSQNSLNLEPSTPMQTSFSLIQPKVQDNSTKINANSSQRPKKSVVPVQTFSLNQGLMKAKFFIINNPVPNSGKTGIKAPLSTISAPSVFPIQKNVSSKTKNVIILPPTINNSSQKKNIIIVKKNPALSTPYVQVTPIPNNAIVSVPSSSKTGSEKTVITSLSNSASFKPGSYFAKSVLKEQPSHIKTSSILGNSNCPTAIPPKSEKQNAEEFILPTTLGSSHPLILNWSSSLTSNSDRPDNSHETKISKYGKIIGFPLMLPGDESDCNSISSVEINSEKLFSSTKKYTSSSSVFSANAFKPIIMHNLHDSKAFPTVNSHTTAESSWNQIKNNFNLKSSTTDEDLEVIEILPSRSSFQQKSHLVTTCRDITCKHDESCQSSFKINHNILKNVLRNSLLKQNWGKKNIGSSYDSSDLETMGHSFAYFTVTETPSCTEVVVEMSDKPLESDDYDQRSQMHSSLLNKKTNGVVTVSAMQQNDLTNDISIVPLEPILPVAENNNDESNCSSLYDELLPPLVIDEYEDKNILTTSPIVNLEKNEETKDKDSTVLKSTAIKTDTLLSFLKDSASNVQKLMNNLRMRAKQSKGNMYTFQKKLQNGKIIVYKTEIPSSTNCTSSSPPKNIQEVFPELKGPSTLYQNIAPKSEISSPVTIKNAPTAGLTCDSFFLVNPANKMPVLLTNDNNMKMLRFDAKELKIKASSSAIERIKSSIKCSSGSSFVIPQSSTSSLPQSMITIIPESITSLAQHSSQTASKVPGVAPSKSPPRTSTQIFQFCPKFVPKNVIASNCSSVTSDSPASSVPSNLLSSVDSSEISSVPEEQSENLFDETKPIVTIINTYPESMKFDIGVNFKTMTQYLTFLKERKGESGLLKMASSSDYFKCMYKECIFTSNCPIEFSTHSTSHTSSPVECAYCLKEFIDVNFLIQHSVLEHRRRIYQCSFCFYRACSKTHIHFHLQMYHSTSNGHVITGIPISTELYFPDEPPLLHIGIKSVSCIFHSCKFSSNSITDVAYHVLKDHKVSFNLQCSECNDRFPSILDWIIHLKSHNISLLHCLYCTYGCNKRMQMLNHLTSRHADFPLMTYVRTSEQLLFILECYLNTNQSASLKGIQCCSSPSTCYCYLLSCPEYEGRIKNLLENVKTKKLHFKLFECLYCQHKASRIGKMEKHLGKEHCSETQLKYYHSVSQSLSNSELKALFNPENLENCDSAEEFLVYSKDEQIIIKESIKEYKLCILQEYLSNGSFQIMSSSAGYPHVVINLPNTNTSDSLGIFERISHSFLKYLKFKSVKPMQFSCSYCSKQKKKLKDLRKHWKNVHVQSGKRFLYSVVIPKQKTTKSEQFNFKDSVPSIDNVDVSIVKIENIYTEGRKVESNPDSITEFSNLYDRVKRKHLRKTVNSSKERKATEMTRKRKVHQRSNWDDCTLCKKKRFVMPDEAGSVSNDYFYLCDLNNLNHLQLSVVFQGFPKLVKLPISYLENLLNFQPEVILKNTVEKSMNSCKIPLDAIYS